MTKARDLASNSTGSKPTLVDAKGDLLVGTAADTAGRLVVGSNGDTLVADSSASTGLRWQGVQAAGRNVLINADFRINQRQTGLTTTSTTFIVDRFSLNYSGGTCSGEQKTFSPGAGISGLASVENYLEYISSGQSGTSDFMRCRGAFEDVYTFAGETVTFSFYAKAATGTPKIALGFSQNFGSGGSSTVTTKAGEVTLSTSWARYSITFTMPSISGKTIGAGNYNTVQFFMSAGSAVDSDLWGIGVQNNTFQFTAFQLEQGSVATPFTTATGTLAGELAACQRYYIQYGGSVVDEFYAWGESASANQILGRLHFPVKMRSTPTLTTSAVGTFKVERSGTAVTSITAVAISGVTSPYVGGFNLTKTSGFTAGAMYAIMANNDLTSYLGWSSEL